MYQKLCLADKYELYYLEGLFSLFHISFSVSLYFCSQGSPGDFEADESGNMLGILLTPEYLIREREARRNASRCNPRVTQKSLQTTESSSKAP